MNHLVVLKILRYILRYIEGAIPAAVFLAVLWVLLEPKCSRKTARHALLGFLGVELALQGALLAGGDSPELALTLLPLTFCLPAILGAHLLSAHPPVPTAVSWLLGLLCQHLLLLTQKLLVFPVNFLEGNAWSWIALGLLVLAAAGLMAVVLRVFCPSFRATAGELRVSWWPLGALLVTLLALHSYFLSGPTAPVVLMMLLFTALVALWVIIRLMTALAAEAQAREFTVQMEALRRDYELLQRKLELGRGYRHDARHHMLALSALLQEGKAEAALDYVNCWQGQLTQIESQSWCKNSAVNAVLSAYVAQAKEAGCTVEAEVSLPETLPVEELDLCVALANALENAIHACQVQGRDQPRHIKLELALTDRRLTLHVENSCAQAVEIGGDGLPAGERRPDHGQGLKSIAAVAKKYHGMLQCGWADGVFTLWLVLLDAAEQPRKIRRAPAVFAGMLLTLFLLNCMPALAQALEAVPILGGVIRIVDLRSYSWFWGDTGVKSELPVLDGDQSAVDAVEAKQEEFIAQMQEAFTAQAARKYQGYVSQDISYKILRDDDALFILRFDAILYAGSSVEYHRHVVLDKGAGQVLSLSDLFLEDVNFVFPISREIKAQMEEQMNADAGDYFLPGGIWTEEECFQSIDPETQDFYINENGQLVIAFAEYEVAPGSMGSPEFVIPTDLLDGILAQPSVLK